MRTSTTKALVLGTVITLGTMALAGCSTGGGGDAGSTSASADTVPIDVGDGMTVNLPKDKKLNIALFTQGTAIKYGQEMIRAADDAAEEYGFTYTLFDPGYDPSKQLSQMQTALQSGKFDAAVVAPTDGTVICKVATEDFPEANVLVSVQSTPLCGLGTAQTADSVPEDLWAPGTMNMVASNNTIKWADAWFDAAAEANPGEQRIAVVTGQETAEQTKVMAIAMENWKKEHPEYTVDMLFGDNTSTKAFELVQTYIQGHPDTSLILSHYTPDVTQGILKAIDAAGKTGEINVVDQGFGEFQIQSIEDGTVQLSAMFYPYNGVKLAFESIVNAQKGDPGPRFVDDSQIGTVTEPFFITKETVGELPAELLG